MHDNPFIIARNGCIARSEIELFSKYYHEIDALLSPMQIASHFSGFNSTSILSSFFLNFSVISKFVSNTLALERLSRGN